MRRGFQVSAALLVAERLGGEPFDHFFCSDLGRALQTAQPTADRTGKKPVATPRLRERNLGVFQGLTGAQCARTYPEAYERFHRRDVDHAMPGGESIRELYQRVSGLFDELASQHAGAQLVIVTHGGVLDALYRHVTGLALDRPRDFPIYNASLNWLRHEHNGWVIEGWGDIGHLTRDAALDDF